jgi:hypothetical protein
MYLMQLIASVFSPVRPRRSTCQPKQQQEADVITKPTKDEPASTRDSSEKNLDSGDHDKTAT